MGNPDRPILLTMDETLMMVPLRLARRCGITALVVSSRPMTLTSNCRRISLAAILGPVIRMCGLRDPAYDDERDEADGRSDTTTLRSETNRRSLLSALPTLRGEHRSALTPLCGPNENFGVYPGFPIRLGALPGFVVGDLMWKALWKFVENEQRFPRRGGRVLCVHGAVSFHRARPCARPVCRPGRHEGSLEAYRQNCDESGLQMSPPGPLRRHDLPDRGQPRYPCADSEPFAYPVR